MPSICFAKITIVLQKLKPQNDLLLRAARGELLERTPVWMMRQAGRYLPEYRAVRAKAGTFLELCKNPELAAEVSVQPYTILGVDAIIMFSDILVIPEAMGAVLDFQQDGPKFREPIRMAVQIDRLQSLSAREIESSCSFVFETLDLIGERINAAVPILGFAGAPWTLASYMIEGGGSKNFAHIKTLMYREPILMHSLLSKLASTVTEYLSLKVQRGASMLQIFDTWASMLDPTDYAVFALPYQQEIISELKSRHPEIPIAIYVNGVTNILDLLLESGANIISVDWRVSLKEVFQRISKLNQGRILTVQGNLDPCHLLGSRDFVRARTLEMLSQARTGRDLSIGYIANLGHGIIPEVSVESAKAFIETVQGARI